MEVMKSMIFMWILLSCFASQKTKKKSEFGFTTSNAFDLSRVIDVVICMFLLHMGDFEYIFVGLHCFMHYTYSPCFCSRLLVA